MGASVSSQPVETWTCQQVSDELQRLGPKYQLYCRSVLDNGVDGDLLSSLITEHEMDETLDDLEIENRLHRRILKKKLTAAILNNNNNNKNRTQQAPTACTSASSSSPEHPSSDDTETTQESLEEGHQIQQKQHPSGSSADTSSSSSSKNSNGLYQHEQHQQQQHDQQQLNESDYQVFDDIVLQALNQTSPEIFYAGIHLIQEQGQLVLSGTIRNSNSNSSNSSTSSVNANGSTGTNDDPTPGTTAALPRWHLQPHHQSLCSQLVRERAPTKYWELDLAPARPMKYRGYVLHNEQGRRIGAVCLMERQQQQQQTNNNRAAAAAATNVVMPSPSSFSSQQQLFPDDNNKNRKNQLLHETTNGTNIASSGGSITTGETTTTTSPEHFMEQMASQIEEQMQQRHALVARTASLQAQIQLLEQQQQQTQQAGTTNSNVVEKLFRQALLPASSSSSSGNSSSSEQEPLPATQKPPLLQGTSDNHIGQPPSPQPLPSPPPANNNSTNQPATVLELPPVTRNTAADNVRLQQAMASGRAATCSDEMPHLPANFFQLHDDLKLPRPPVAKTDVCSIATVEELNLHSIQPDSATGRRLLQIITMAAKMTHCPIACLNFHDHEREYGIGRPVAQRERVNDMMSAGGVQVTRRAADGNPFFYGAARSPAICNYTLFLQETFVVPDIAQDGTFRIMAELSGARFYAGTPIIFADNSVIASLCLVDVRPRHDFSQTQQMQLEQLAFMLMLEIQNWSMWNRVEKLERTRSRLLANTEKLHPPSREATVTRTDVASSTDLWERDACAMREALEIHDTILRKCSLKHHGYEIDTAGDAFYLAFHDPVDAIAFALEVQVLLFEADWSPEILKLSDMSSSHDGSCFRGLSVRMGLIHGNVISHQQEVTGRTEYSGIAWNLSRSLEDMAHGGQILTTLDTWNIASSLGEKSLGGFQVLDLGKHVMKQGNAWNEGVIAKSVVQLVPKSLSFDYFVARRPPKRSESTLDVAPLEGNVMVSSPPEPAGSVISGRQFPPPISKRQLSPSFHDAPFKDSQVTILFLSTEEIEQRFDAECRELKTSLVRLVGELIVSFGKGYHCKNTMLAFGSPEDAIRFSFLCLKTLRERESKSSSDADTKKTVISDLVKFGCIHGQFASMGPHRTSGRAEYFGKVVNRADRVASEATPGAVYLGDAGEDKTMPDIGHGIALTLIRTARLRGIQEDISLFSCIEDKSVVNGHGYS